MDTAVPDSLTITGDELANVVAGRVRADPIGDGSAACIPYAGASNGTGISTVYTASDGSPNVYTYTYTYPSSTSANSDSVTYGDPGDYDAAADTES